jgi:YHS domain-containing protein
MTTIEDLERRIKERLEMNEEQRRLRQDQLKQTMNHLEERLKRYTITADRLMETVIRSRLEALGRYLPGLRPVEDRCSRHTRVYRSEPDERIPATVTLEMGVTRDGQAQTLTVFSNLQIVPVLFSFDGSDQFIFPVDAIDESRVTAWVDDHIVRFLDTCLRVESTDIYQATNLVVDPVCGMSINKAVASASMEYHGHRYYFCVEACRSRFAEDPERYLTAGKDGGA